MSTPTTTCAVAIRALAASDTRALEWHGGAHLRAFYEEQWRAHRAGEIHVLIADHDGHPVGQIAIHWKGKPTHPQIPDLQSLRVREDFRGLGVGTRLLAASEEVARVRGHDHLSLSVALDNLAARRLYERLGYHIVGAPYCDVWFYVDAQGQSQRVEETVLDMVKELL